MPVDSGLRCGPEKAGLQTNASRDISYLASNPAMDGRFRLMPGRQAASRG